MTPVEWGLVTSLILVLPPAVARGGQALGDAIGGWLGVWEAKRELAAIQRERERLGRSLTKDETVAVLRRLKGGRAAR